MAPRKAVVKRETKETIIEAELALDGRGEVDVYTGLAFFDHLIKAAMTHGYFNLTLAAKGDLDVDAHHTVEDVGLVLGQAFKEALGDFAGVKRFGEAHVPMDDALARAVVDLSRRPFLSITMPNYPEKPGGFEPQLVEEFWRAFAVALGSNLHLAMISGRNAHHCLEAMFKAAGRALDVATSVEPRAQGVTSTKGVL